STMPLAAVSPVEHDSILRLAPRAPRLPVDAGGRVTGAGPGLNAIQHVNNETGVIQPLDELAREIHAAGGLLLADCAQSAGKLPLPPADLIAISAHKFGGPIGVGALLVREWSMLAPTGGQEQGYRPGTENLPGALAMAAALEAGNAWLDEARRLRASLETRIEAAGGAVIGRSLPRLATIGAIRMPGKAAAVQLIRFDAMGIAVSAGSACSSGSLKPSHVLAAMQTPHASEVIRVSIGRETTQGDIDRFVVAWQEVQG
ncbi:MAG TPA: aminotransferase class V-fold PLP-dependent enzyme, partial [Myxococcales bacterium]